MAISLGNLAVSGAKALAGYGRGQLAGRQVALGEEHQRRQTAEEALRLSLALRSDQRAGRAESRADEALSSLEAERADNRRYRDALSRRRGGLTAREEQSDAYAAARAIAEYQAGTNARAWKAETLGVYLKARFPKLDQDRLLGVAQNALAKGGGLPQLSPDDLVP